MGINLGILGQVLSRGYAGYARGRVEAEDRRIEEEERKRRAAHDALVDQIMRDREARESADYQHTVERRPILEGREDQDYTYRTGRRQVEDTREDADYQHNLERRGVTEGREDEKYTHDLERRPVLERREDEEADAEARFRRARAKYYEGGGGRTEKDYATRKREYILKNIPSRTRPRVQRDPLSGAVTMVPGDDPAAAYRALAEEFDMAERGEVPNQAMPKSSRNPWGAKEAPRGDQTGWEPTDMNPGRSTVPPDSTAAAPEPAADDDPMAEARAEWDRLAQEFGVEETTKQIGPRP